MYGDERREELKNLLFEQAKVAAGLQRAEEEWLALSAELEATAG
jgi:hypothetical protein